MPEIEVKFATRYIKRKRTNAIGKSLLKTLTEPITNSDDSYSRLLSSKKCETVCPIDIFIDYKKRLVKIIDRAEGMSKQELIRKFQTYGSEESGASEGKQVRGIFGQGISDVLFYHSKGVIKSIKGGKSSICRFYEKKGRPFINIKKAVGSTLKLSREWGINSKHGTLVEFILGEGTTIPSFKNLVKNLSSFYMLRFINSDDNRRVRLTCVDRNGKKKESIVNYFFPKGDLIESKNFVMNFEKYDPINIDVQLYKSKERLQRVGDERENGILVSDSKKAIYDLTFFGLDNLPGTDKFYGFMKLTGARDIILDKMNSKKRPEEILADSRNGFNRSHEFYKKLEGIMKDWLYPILSEERKITSDEELSEATKERHRKAFDELNMRYAELSGEGSSGTIRAIKEVKSVNGLEFARNRIYITVKKSYGIQLLIDTKKIRPGSEIILNASKKKIGFAPQKINVVKPTNKTGVLVKTVTITGNKADTVDTLTASSKKYRSSVVVSVIRHEIIYPENGLIFHPDYFRAILNRKSSLNLYVDLSKIKKGSKVKLTCSEESIKIKNEEVIVEGQLWHTNKITRLVIPFVGTKLDETGIIEANCLGFTTNARIDIKKRITRKPTSSIGKFKGWMFDKSVGSPFQATYDSNPESPTYGFILINPNHPINKRYFGDNPKKSDVEKSLSAQLYLAELILNESLNVTIPEALQRGILPRRLEDYDVLYYIAQKKFEYGSSIYKCFVSKKSAQETYVKKQLQKILKSDLKPDSALLDGLKEREKQMVEMRLGLNNQRPHTLSEIGNNFDITRERVRQIIDGALYKKRNHYDYSDIETLKSDKINEGQNKNIKNTKVIIDKILGKVSSFYDLDNYQIKEKTRKKTIVMARYTAIYLLRDLTGLSFPSIGRIFDLDHTTAIYGFDKILEKIEKDEMLRDKINLIKDKVKKECEISDIKR